MVKVEIDRFAQSKNNAPPSRVGQRYNVAGFLPEAGNTIVCHLDTLHPGHKAVLNARDRMKALPAAERFLFTPASSLHMTVSEGVIETNRTPDAWPAGMDTEASVDEVTEALAPRFSDFTPPAGFSVCAEAVAPTGLMLRGATDADEENLRAWRTALTGPMGFRRREHDTYRFHMTFAYVLDWLPDDLIPVWQSGLHAILRDLLEEAPTIPLMRPAFCTFADMNHFETRVSL